MNKIEIPYQILALAAVLAFLAIAPMPYGFYTFVRIIVCGCGGVICYQLWNNGYRGAWLWMWGMIAILFNPIANIHMTKEIWMVIDAFSGVIFVFFAYRGYRINHKSS